MSDAAPRPSRVRWIAPFAVNAVLGYVGIIPIGFVWFFLVSRPLAALGLTEGDPTDNDGLLPWLILLAGVGLFFVLWAVANAALRRLSRLPARPYWRMAGLLLIAPAVSTMVFPPAYEAWKLSLSWL